jgi:hypothetical protein
MQNIKPTHFLAAPDHPSAVSDILDRVAGIAPAPLLPGEQEAEYDTHVARIIAAALALMRAIPRDPDSPYVFPTRLVGLFRPWDRIRRRAELADVRLHDLRHSFASFLVNQGVSLYVVQGLLGHASPRMTQRYAHLAPQTLLDAAEMVSSVIGANQITAVSEATRAPPCV